MTMAILTPTTNVNFYPIFKAAGRLKAVFMTVRAPSALAEGVLFLSSRSFWKSPKLWLDGHRTNIFRRTVTLTTPSHHEAILSQPRKGGEIGVLASEVEEENR